ncbi:ABC transporter permease [candidate division KSB1 bacterium]|nr:ABC transporter permease [candidate division KSB1 bacterium]
MLPSLLRRLLQSLVLIWGVLTLTFFLLQLSPGDPMDRFISPRIPPETLAQIRRQLGFDQPLPLQYLKWLQQWLQGDWGYSLAQHRPVTQILAEAIPATLALTIPVLALSLVLGIALGAAGAFYRNRWFDRFLSNVILAAYSMPSFWLGLMVILLFALKLKWLPNSEASSLFAENMDALTALKDRIRHLLLPMFTLALPGAAAIARYTRENFITVLESDFIRLARAKGLSPAQLIMRHASPHILLPLISLCGLSLPFLMGGAFLTEIIFAWPGMGRVTFEAIFSRDYPVVLAATSLSAFTTIGGNFVADVLYRIADPRIR